MSNSEISRLDDENSIDTRITLEVLILFLCGSRRATLVLASRTDTLRLGLVFVFSAAFAREYDGTDLIREPWHLLIPVAASIGASFVLFLLAELVVRAGGFDGSRFWSRYRTFLSLFWMTAPLAWVYAIPVERVLNNSDAIVVNLWLLGLVASWRILLITRVLSILYVFDFREVAFSGFLFVVMLFADTVVVFFLTNLRLPFAVGISFMAGARIVQPNQSLNYLSFWLSLASILSLPVWLSTTMTIMFGDWCEWAWNPKHDPSPAPMSMSVKLLAIASLLIWAFVLPFTQLELQRQNQTGTEHRAIRI